MTKNALLKRGPKNSGMGRPPPHHLGNARKKAFFFIDVFPKASASVGRLSSYFLWMQFHFLETLISIMWYRLQRSYLSTATKEHKTNQFLMSWMYPSHCAKIPKQWYTRPSCSIRTMFYDRKFFHFLPSAILNIVQITYWAELSLKGMEHQADSGRRPSSQGR